MLLRVSVERGVSIERRTVEGAEGAVVDTYSETKVKDFELRLKQHLSAKERASSAVGLEPGELVQEHRWRSTGVIPAADGSAHRRAGFDTKNKGATKNTATSSATDHAGSKEEPNFSSTFRSTKTKMAASSSGNDTTGAPPPALRVCFVCTGNTCRSFMAEYVAKAFLVASSDEAVRAKTKHWHLCSRGTSLRESVPHPTALQALGEIAGFPIPNPDLEKHRPTDLKSSPPHLLVEPGNVSQTYYFCMTRQHREALLALLGPAAFDGRAKVFLLADNSDDISDPYNGPITDYRDCLETLQKWTRVVLLNLQAGKEPFD
ncbi:unnamed protein product [Amoebophrya sp. A120]|nr:unnamed protein product [Amoebophrya sp. A120]|eukprot:GSA120T00017716001.1